MQHISIPFSGIALTPYSDISKDGQLAACIGLEQHGAAWRPSMLTGRKYQSTLQDSGTFTLSHIHTTSAYSHFIFQDGSLIYWADTDKDDYTPQLVGAYTGITHIQSVGNTLVVFTPQGLHYYLWKDSTYNYIGQQPPEINLSFGLISGEFKLQTSDEVKLYADYVPSGSPERINFNNEDNQHAYITDLAWSAINQAIDSCNKNNRFCYPFYVRAAYRRFDGSYTMLTSPVLMIPDSYGPRAYLVATGLYDNRVTGFVYSRATFGWLVARAIQSSVTTLTNWKDIVSSIDIFVSPQVPRLDDSRPVTAVYGRTLSGFPNGMTDPPESYGISRTSDDSTFQVRNFNLWTDGVVRYFAVGTKSDETFIQDLTESTLFYRVASFGIEQYIQMADSDFDVMQRGVDLGNITLQESLPDSADYQSHDLISASRGHVYNQRLHLFDIARHPFTGFTPESMFTRTSNGASYAVNIRVCINTEDGQERVVSIDTALPSWVRLSALGRFLYYPDPNAYRMTITSSGGDFSHDIPLKPHPVLNGAYYLFIDTPPASTTVDVPQLYAEPIKQPNKIYTSEVGNPFYFPLEGIYTVGAGEIFGISSVATTLSQGQFGQFPLIIFCSDGNYAMSVNEEGRYSAIHPLQRDVCINPGSITQTDAEVLFVTSRGVMTTVGAGAQCLSTQLDGVHESLPQELAAYVAPTESPNTFFSSCRIAYDYTNRRFIFFSPDKEISYIYSIESAAWSTANFGFIRAVINQFPYSYVQLSSGAVILLSGVYPYTGNHQQGLIYTRPVKMETYELKRIQQIILQGNFQQPQPISIFGSNDGSTWHYIGTSSGSYTNRLVGRSFKYYRFGVQTNLSPAENISMLRIAYQVNPNRKFR